LKLSVVLITKNEIQNIERAIRSVKKIADEIVVVDTYSDDGTDKLAASLGAKVIQTEFRGFSDTKNFAIEQTSGDWIFVLDADEEVNGNLAAEIRRLVELDGSGVVCYGVARKSSFLGKWINYSGWFPDYSLRLFKKGRARFKKARVHESLDADGKVGYVDSKFYMNHYTYRTLKQYFDKFNLYTSLAAKDMRDRGKDGRLSKIIVNPPLIFFKKYILKLGFLDGFHGFVLAVFSSFYVFVKYLKLRFSEDD